MKALPRYAKSKEDGKPMRIRYAAACLAACAALVLGGARAEWYVFETDKPPEALLDAAMQVSGFSGEVTLSFLGDCTLGGESKAANSRGGFVQTALREGYDYPFQNLASLLGSDDVTVVNLEGVLSDRKLDRVKKTFNFKGPADFATILPLGGVELAGLSNNHTQDYGAQGYADTKTALEAAGVAYFDSDHVAVWAQDGVMIGFTGSAFSLSTGAQKNLREQMEVLREVGCQLIVHSMHAGTEYEREPTSQQKTVAAHAVDMGADLVVGHHPHVVQGYELMDGVPVVYSLGNAVFGGNRDPRDYDALLLQAVFTYEAGVPVSVRLVFYPISVSGEAGYNNYQPVLLTGGDAQRVLDKMADSTGVAPPAFAEGEGAVTEAFPIGGT